MQAQKTTDAASDAAGAPAQSDVRASFKSFLTQRGLRVSKQRMAIFDAVLSQQGHFTAESLLDAARAIDRTVSRATVYRALPVLVANGLVRQVDIGAAQKFYMNTLHQRTFQAQIVCPDCARITEVDAPFMEWYGKAVSAQHNMELVSQRLQVIARCPECAAAKKARTLRSGLP